MSGPCVDQGKVTSRRINQDKGPKGVFTLACLARMEEKKTDVLAVV